MFTLALFVKLRSKANFLKIGHIRVAPPTSACYPTRGKVHGNVVSLAVTLVKMQRRYIRVVIDIFRSVLTSET